MRIALATEGKSEHWITKHLIQYYFKEKEIYFRQVQPQILDDTQESVGGWLEIIKFCKRTEDVKSALIESDYLIIQIDTDESQNIQFGVSHTKQDNSVKTAEELHEEIVSKLLEIIDPEIIAEYGNKIFFAICIHSIECWLLPIYYSNNHRTDTRNCFTTLNQELRRRDLPPVSSKKQKENRKKAYDAILKNWKRKKDIVDNAKYNVGFKNFVASLKSIEDNL